ncbi:MAG: 30S ribosomal protein S8 [Clostridia bacterium]|nr:30S ribosomal protein S8 [Clostridia bacterium]
MLITDTIADMLTRIRNALVAKHETVNIPASTIKLEIARILKEEGYINGYNVVENGVERTLVVTLKYGPNREKVITGLKRISRPGLRIYARKDNLPRVLNGMGIAIISTSRGMMTDRECRKLGIGGEVLAYVW